jgi:mono/diheme cytochrome c family protein
VHGIGRYSFEDFRRAMREGTARGARHLYPAMPYASYVKDHRRRSQGAVRLPASTACRRRTTHHPGDQASLSFQSALVALRFWKGRFPPAAAVYVEKPGRDAEWNRGAYLDCSRWAIAARAIRRAARHTRSAGTTNRPGSFLTGMVNDNWYATNLTGDRGCRTSAAPDAATIARPAAHGPRRRAGRVSGSMAEEVEQSLQHITEADARAVASYLKTLPAQRNQGGYTPGGAKSRSAAQGNRTGDVEATGASVYRSFCAQCHQADGKGIPDMFPRLAGNPSVLGEDATSLMRLVIQGGRSPRTATGPAPQMMPGFASTLTDVQMAQTLTYVRQAWGNDAKPVTTNDVTKLRATLKN